MSVFPFSPGGWHLSNDYCSEPLERLYWTNRIKAGIHLCPQAASIPEGNITPLSPQGHRKNGDAGHLGEVPGVSRKDYKCEKSEKPLILDFDLLVVLLVLPAWRGWQKGQCGVSQGGEAQEPCLGGPLGLQLRRHWRLWCLMWSSGLSRILSISLI